MWFLGSGKISQLEDSISFRIPSKANDHQAPGKCILKLASIFQLNSEGSLPVSVGCLPSIDGGGNPNAGLDAFTRDKFSCRAFL